MLPIIKSRCVVVEKTSKKTKFKKFGTGFIFELDCQDFNIGDIVHFDFISRRKWFVCGMNKI